MVDFAELLVDTVASADWAFFAKNGNDVTSLSVMAAGRIPPEEDCIFPGVLPRGIPLDPETGLSRHH